MNGLGISADIVGLVVVIIGLAIWFHRSVADLQHRGAAVERLLIEILDHERRQELVLERQCGRLKGIHQAVGGVARDQEKTLEALHKEGEQHAKILSRME